MPSLQDSIFNQTSSQASAQRSDLGYETQALEAQIKKQKLISSLVIKGRDFTHTAMALTVGLPLAVCVKLILQKKINLTGVVIPTQKEIYLPVLKELEELGIVFKEKILPA